VLKLCPVITGLIAGMAYPSRSVLFRIKFRLLVEDGDVKILMIFRSFYAHLTVT